MSKITFDLKTPMVPNFIRVHHIGCEHEKDLPSIDVADLSKEQLEAIADNWKKDLLLKSETRKLQKVTKELLPTGNMFN